MTTARLNPQQIQATLNSSGNGTLTYSANEATGGIVVVSIQWLNAPPTSAQGLLQLNGFPLGVLASTASFGPITLLWNDVLTLQVTGGTANTTVTAILNGYRTDKMPDPPLIPMFTAAANVTATSESNGMQLLETVNGPSIATLSFQNISQAYENLLLELTGEAALAAPITWTFNADAGANYNDIVMYSTTAAVLNASANNGNSCSTHVNAVSASSFTPCTFRLKIPNYPSRANPFALLAFISEFSYYNYTVGNDAVIGHGGHVYESSAAISRIDVSCGGGNTWLASTVARLYGY